MVILGLDPGTATTGYGVIKKERDKLFCVSFGCIRTPSGLDMPNRLKKIREELLALVQIHAPRVAAIEQLFFAKNLKTAIAVAHARGIALEGLASAGVLLCEYTPLQVKQAVTGYGRAEKIQVQQMVKLLLNLESAPKPDDAADALAIAICCAHSYASIN